MYNFVNHTGKASLAIRMSGNGGQEGRTEAICSIFASRAGGQQAIHQRWAPTTARVFSVTRL